MEGLFVNTIVGVQKAHRRSKKEAVILVYSGSKYLSTDAHYSAFIQPLSELDYNKSPAGY